jgi:hypothetical protein
MSTGVKSGHGPDMVPMSDPSSRKQQVMTIGSVPQNAIELHYVGTVNSGSPPMTHHPEVLTVLCEGIFITDSIYMIRRMIRTCKDIPHETSPTL